MKIIINLKKTKEVDAAKQIYLLFRDIEDKYKDNPIIAGFDLI